MVLPRDVEVLLDFFKEGEATADEVDQSITHKPTRY